MRINHNVSSVHTQGALFMNNRAVSQSLEKLSTGLRVNKASDDAAGLAVSEGLRTQIRGQEQAKRNALDGISALNIAEGAMDELHNIMQRQRELAIQSANNTYSQTERAYMDQEFQAMSEEIDRIISATNFNGIKLFSHPDRNMAVDHAGANESNRGQIQTWDNKFENKYLEEVVKGARQLERDGVVVHANAEAGAAWLNGVINQARNQLAEWQDGAGRLTGIPQEGFSNGMFSINTGDQSLVAQGQSDFNAEQIKLLNAQSAYAVLQRANDTAAANAASTQLAFTNAMAAYENAVHAAAQDPSNAALSAAVGTAFTAMNNAQTAAATASTTWVGTANAVTAGLEDLNGAQSAFNDARAAFAIVASQNMDIKFNIELRPEQEVTVFELGTQFNGEHLWVDANDAKNIDSLQIRYGNIDKVTARIDGLDSSNAEAAIAAMDFHIQQVSAARADVGALVNRLESTIKNLTNSIVNQTAAESQIRDADFAFESSKFTRNQIMVQSATSMLAQANASTQGVLSLLR